MAFTLPHILVSHRLDVVPQEDGPDIFFTVAAERSFQLLYPGRLDKQARATVRHSMRIETPDTTVPEPPGGIDVPGQPPQPHPTPQPLHNGVQVNEEMIELELRIFDPDGVPFAREEVTLADLKKFRDLRGSPRGQWRYTLTGRSRVYTPVAALNETVSDPKGAITLSVRETVPSTSAPPLVPRTWLNESRMQMTFDLNRVGNLVVTIEASANPLTGWRGSVRLLDPDGVRIASSTTRHLRYAVPLSALGKSRDAAGNPRLWSLEVQQQGRLVNPDAILTATVRGEGRIGVAALQERIQALIGPDGTFIELVGVNSGGEAKAVLTITDVVAAETIDMHGLLDARLEKEGHQSTNIAKGTPMVLYHRNADFDYGLTLDVSTVSLKSINVEIGPGKGLGADTPVIRLIVRINGSVKVKWRGLTLADAKLRGGRVDMEVGIQIDPEGTPRIAQWVTDEPFDIDVDDGVVAALVYAASVISGVGAVTAVAIAECVEETVNEGFAKGAAELFDDPSLAPRILMTLFGTHLTYLSPRFEGGDILFEHIAPLETEPKPRRNYAGAIGRTVIHDAMGRPTFMPETLGDTWAADNLKNKIDHIVVVMMENRSYDHVLGYRALPPVSDGADGLTAELMSVINKAAPRNPEHVDPGSDPVDPVHPLRNAEFPLNNLNLRTQIPVGVGHALADVQQQLSGQIDGPGGRRINDPNGFVDNFVEKKLHNKPRRDDGVGLFDVLGYYETNEALQDPNTRQPVNDLPIYSFLAENYAYCDRYFCSHAGPTLPNRMYSLTGDVQRDRLGVPILDNNHGDNFLLSRALTIHDILTRRGVSWRVYESDPSVGMLRMFARYATDTVNIRSFKDDFAKDVADGDLPSVTVIEPAMHHQPQDDDHPPADMYQGQIFIRKVYKALREGRNWGKTLLLITYDEHGGLYDHVIPPIADVLSPSPSFHTEGPVVTVPMTEVGVHTDGPVVTVPMTEVGVHTEGPVVTVPMTEGGVHPEGPIVTVPMIEDEIDTTIEIPYGVRVPTFVVSPWTVPGKGPSVTLDHCSILKTILARFCGDVKPFLSDRVRDSHSFESFLTAEQPRVDLADPPVLGELTFTPLTLVSGASNTDTPPLYRARMREEQVDFHEITGRLARMLGR